MIEFEKKIFPNGLTVLVHTDTSTPMACMNILYKVGARDESPDKTGFAHLFEHLMFGGSLNIPSYDTPLQLAGGDNNAFTNNDITNYYLTIPAANLETAFWLESDRMLSLAFSEKSLSVQQNVVIEEFKQRYLNQPYGDLWLLLRPLAYEVHPYRWSTIGKEISHIENASLQDVKNFFFTHYNPSNAILSFAGNASAARIFELVEKWFGEIERPYTYQKSYLPEPVQKEKRVMMVEREVPYDMLVKAFHCCSRLDQKYYSTDLLTDIAGRGRSARFYNSLVKEQKLFSDIMCFNTGEFDEGLVVAGGKLVKGVRFEDAEAALDNELQLLKENLVEKDELNKVKNNVESAMVFSEIDLSGRALNLALAEYMGNPELINTDIENYLQVSSEEIQQRGVELFTENNSSVLYYKSIES